MDGEVENVVSGQEEEEEVVVVVVRMMMIGKWGRNTQ